MMTSLLSADEGIGVQDSSAHTNEVSQADSVMHSPAGPEVPLPHTTTSQEIPAYFALEFPDVQFTYYLQKLSVSLGRSDAAADIDLGALKNISRLHARIEYEEQLEQFVLAVIGRNGAFVDGTWHEPGERVPLAERWVQDWVITSLLHSWELHRVPTVVVLIDYGVFPLDYYLKPSVLANRAMWVYWPGPTELGALSSLLISTMLDTGRYRRTIRPSVYAKMHALFVYR
jgi:FHA domain